MAISECLGRRCNLLLVASVLLLVPGLGLGFQQETKTAAEKISATLEKQGRKSVAVVDFTDLQGSVTELGRFMAEQLSVALASEDRSFKVIDRGHLRKVLREQGLGSSGVIDPTTAQEVGRIAGVDTLITGTLTPFGETVSLSIKALDTKTAENIRAMSVEIPKTNAIAELLGRGLGAIEAGSPQAKAEPPPADRKVAPPPPKKATSNGFTFELRTCSRLNETRIVCDFLVTNNEPERVLVLFAEEGERFSSQCIDSMGKATRATVARSGAQADKRLVEVRLHQDVPSLSSLEFDGVDADETALKALIISARISWGADFRVSLRDIPIMAATGSHRASETKSAPTTRWGVRVRATPW